MCPPRIGYAMQKYVGFSLLELLIVLSIIAILSTLGIISIQSFQQKSQAEVIKSQLLRAIQVTRSEAILRNEKIILCHSHDQKTCSGSWQEGFIVKSASRVLHVFQSFFTNGTLHWRAFPLDREELEFLPTGVPHAENGTFWFCTAKNPAWAMILNKAGRVRMVYPNQQGIILDPKGILLVCS
jgi:type IV fimbrial biogenesis protein FimT